MAAPGLAREDSKEIVVTAMRGMQGLSEAEADSSSDEMVITGNVASRQSRAAAAKARTSEADEDIAAFDRAIRRAPRNASAYLGRGLAYQNKGDFRRARADFDRAIRYAPNDPQGYRHRALLLRRIGEVRAAEKDEARAIALEGNYRSVVK